MKKKKTNAQNEQPISIEIPDPQATASQEAAPGPQAEQKAIQQRMEAEAASKAAELTDEQVVENMFSASAAMFNRLNELPKDPDLVSVVSIAEAHGYKFKSPLWMPQMKAFGDALALYAAKKKAKQDKK